MLCSLIYRNGRAAPIRCVIVVILIVIIFFQIKFIVDHFLHRNISNSLILGWKEPFEKYEKLIKLKPLANDSLTESYLVQSMKKALPNLPIGDWMPMKPIKIKYNKTCAEIPSILDLHYNNIYWQTFQTRIATFQLFGAYLDTRPVNPLAPIIRITAMIKNLEPNQTIYCQMWFEKKKKMLIVRTNIYQQIWMWKLKKQNFSPFLISCVIPKQFKSLIPDSVSLVEHQCDNANNRLKVFYDKPIRKKDFAVCVKGLDYQHEDISKQLIEWIELIYLLGADKIFMYNLNVHPNINKVLKYYENKNQIEVSQLTLPEGQPNAPFLQHYFIKFRHNQKVLNEVIPYNDCFYKHMYQYKYIVLLDIDEIIMPLKVITWNELIKNVLNKTNGVEKAFYSVGNAHFINNLTDDNSIPKYTFMLQRVYRFKNISDSYGKSFFNTDKVLTLHNHQPLQCLQSVCTKYRIDKSDAYLQHYRKQCYNNCENRMKTVIMDNTIWRFKESLTARVRVTLSNLGFSSEEEQSDT